MKDLDLMTREITYTRGEIKDLDLIKRERLLVH